VQVASGNSWLQVSTGPYHTVALRNDYTVWSWGMNFVGQLGTNDVLYRSSPVQTFGGGSFNLI
jgi:alpha-tubulin suppressor-like RCC1 family protein